jgi:hypothetical protein
VGVAALLAEIDREPTMPLDWVKVNTTHPKMTCCMPKLS